MLVNKYILKATVDSRDLKPLGFELSNLKRIPDIGIDSYYEYKISRSCIWYIKQ